MTEGEMADIWLLLATFAGGAELRWVSFVKGIDLTFGYRIHSGCGIVIGVPSVTWVV